MLTLALSILLLELGVASLAFGAYTSRAPANDQQELASGLLAILLCLIASSVLLAAGIALWP